MANQPRSPFYVPKPPDETYWYLQPRDRLILPLLTAVKFYGAGGQAPTPRWSRYYHYSELPFWQGSPIGSQTLRPLYGIKVNNKQQRYDYSEQGFWEGRPRGSQLIRPLLTAAGQVKNKQSQALFQYFEVPTEWVGTPRGSQTIHPLLTAAGQPPTKRWGGYYTTFDETPWFYTFRQTLQEQEFFGRVIDTVTYSQHPVNCMMAGDEPPEYHRRITEWSRPGGEMKETHTAHKRGGQIPTMRHGSKMSADMARKLYGAD